jgi:5-methylcytosine-specific restriction protein A
MQRAKQICNKVGCNVLIDSPGRCELHKIKDSERFSHLKKAEGSEEFYNSSKWKLTRHSYRTKNPLCEECKRDGIIKAMYIVDHKIERNDLIKAGLSPYEHKYLQSLCHACHNKKLRQRRDIGEIEVFYSG